MKNRIGVKSIALEKCKQEVHKIKDGNQHLITTSKV
jgi:hypothetical protein